MRIPVQTNQSRRPNQSLVTHYSYLDGLAFAGHNHKRNKTAVWKVNELQLFARLMEAGMTREILKRQKRTQRLIFRLRKRKQNTIVYEPSFVIRAFPGQ
jgi:hypothetical protein